MTSINAALKSVTQCILSKVLKGLGQPLLHAGKVGSRTLLCEGAVLISKCRLELSEKEMLQLEVVLQVDWDLLG